MTDILSQVRCFRSMYEGKMVAEIGIALILWQLGLCLGWKGQWICCVTRGGGREGGRGRRGK